MLNVGKKLLNNGLSGFVKNFLRFSSKVHRKGSGEFQNFGANKALLGYRGVHSVKYEVPKSVVFHLKPRRTEIFKEFSVTNNKYGHKFVLVDKNLDLKSMISQEYFFKTPPYGSNNNKLYVYNRGGEELGCWPRFYFRKIIGYFGEYCMVHNRGNSSLEAYYLDEKGESCVQKIELPFDILDPLQVSLTKHGTFYVAGERHICVFNESLDKISTLAIYGCKQRSAIVGIKNRVYYFGKDVASLFSLEEKEGKYHITGKRARYYPDDKYYMEERNVNKDEFYCFDDSCYILMQGSRSTYLLKFDYNCIKLKRSVELKRSAHFYAKIIPEEGLLIRSFENGININGMNGGVLLRSINDKLFNCEFKVDINSGCFYYINADGELVARDLQWMGSTVIERNVNARIVDTDDSGIVYLKPTDE